MSSVTALMTRIRGSVSRKRPLARTNAVAIAPRPRRAYTLGLLRIAIVSVPFIYGGAMIAKYFAATLEEHDLFVPDDDDDD